MSRRPPHVLLVDSEGLNPYGRCLAFALRDAGVQLEFHRRHAPGISGFGRPFGPIRSGHGHRWLRALRLGAGLVRVAVRVPKSDVVHTLWESRADLLLAAFAKHVCRRRVVSTLHDAARPGKRAQRTLRWLTRVADQIIVHSPHIERELALRVANARNKIEIVPLINYTSHVGAGDRRGARMRLGLAAKRPLILFFGQLRAGKGLNTLLDAAERMLPRDPRLQLAIAGSDPDRTWADALAAMEARYPTQIVLFVDERPLAETVLTDLLIAADLVALPFTRAAQSSSAIFALSHRRAVVTTSVGAVEELGLEGAVLLVDPGDPTQLADACTRLIALPRARDELADVGFRYASTELAPGRIAELTCALYDAAPRGAAR